MRSSVKRTIVAGRVVSLRLEADGFADECILEAFHDVFLRHEPPDSVLVRRHNEDGYSMTTWAAGEDDAEGEQEATEENFGDEGLS